MSIPKEDILNLFHIVDVERKPKDEFIDDIAYVLKKHDAFFSLDHEGYKIKQINSSKFNSITNMRRFVIDVENKAFGASDET